jgi:beta-lactamase class A
MTPIFLVYVLAAPRPAAPALAAQLDAIAAPFRGRMGYSIHFRRKNERIERNADEAFPTASTIKLAILCSAMEKIDRGEWKYSDTREYKEIDKRGGAGFIQNYKIGTKLELKELLHLMITVSDNTATAMMIRWLTPKEINGWLDRHGLKNTRILSQLPPEEIELRKLADKWGLGVTTPREMVSLMEQIADDKAGSPTACDEMQRILTHQYFNDLIAKQFPPWVSVASKSGAVNQSRSDVALIHSPAGDITIAVYTKDNVDQSWTDSNEAEVAIKKISAAVWKFYNPKVKWTQPKQL